MMEQICFFVDKFSAEKCGCNEYRSILETLATHALYHKKDDIKGGILSKYYLS